MVGANFIAWALPVDDASAAPAPMALCKASLSCSALCLYSRTKHEGERTEHSLLSIKTTHKILKSDIL